MTRQVMVDREALSAVLSLFPDPIRSDRLGDYRPEVAQAVQALREALTQPQAPAWIPVGERLPGVPHTVLFYSPATYWRGCHNIGYLLPDGKWHAQGFDQPLSPNFVTHWQPLPTPPEAK